MGDVTKGFAAYKCHKVVSAFHIASIQSKFGLFIFTDTEGNEWRAPSTFMDKHEPKTGGYIVKYEDGYVSYSPREAFEAGYSLITEEQK